ncbi:MAG: hypothetical protein COV66_11085 [Nitrospinae bacterium CG11_big_fil_rev_8_21_14_0_20_45_15]|nr:MAG: hypothetical protein COV66_11085 [Nitrospinae bacterium CG11_big_fil_rev_8_21_14_0_20_45_15]
MAKKQKSTGQRNFFRVMAVIGVVAIYFLGREFMSAAPRLSPSTEHKAAQTAEDCLACHMGQIKEIPIMPHRPMGTCTFCHEKTTLPGS